MTPESAPRPLDPPVLVTAREHLEEIVSDIAGFPALGFDTESNGFYAYREKVCLIQISSPKTDYIVDPIAIKDISGLGSILSNPAIEKIFHAAEYDIMGLRRDYGFSPAPIFDTMIAGKFLGWRELGLAKAIEAQFGVSLSKKLQKADWSRRPLSEEHLRYAQADTHYLIELSRIQKKLLSEKGRMEDALESCLEIEAAQAPTKIFDPDAFWNMSGARELSGTQKGCLKEICLLREVEAKSRDLAPFRVMSEDLMVRLAAHAPKDREELSRIKGMSPYLIQKMGSRILDAIARGLSGLPALEKPPGHPRVRRNAKEEKIFESLRQWRKAQAESEGLDPGAILSAGILREMARRSAAGENPLSALTPLKRTRHEAALRRFLDLDKTQS
ncbi:MAG: ribonuclease D [Elusimicrobiota bacterium]